MLAKLLTAIAACSSLVAPSVAADPLLKDPVYGLVDRNGIAPRAYEGVVDAFVIRVPWATIQPTREPRTNHGGPLNLTEITNALNATRARGKAVRLRVTAGAEAPQWAKELTGTPLQWFADGIPVEPNGTIGAFWKREFREAYEDLQRRLRDAYDNDERIREVVISRCTTQFVEPYIRQAESLAQNEASLNAGGYTLALDQSCHYEEIDAHKIWEHTRSYLAFNPYQKLDKVGGRWVSEVDNNFTKQMITYCRSALGNRCVLGNNSLDPDRPARYLEMYQHMKNTGRPIAFQTATAAKVCEDKDPCPESLWKKTLDMALTYDASSVELPDGRTGYTSWALDGLKYYDDELTKRKPSL